MYGSPCGADQEADTDAASQPSEHGPHWCIDSARVCVFRATELLMLGERWRLNEFMAAWKDAVPDGVVPHEDILKVPRALCVYIVVNVYTYMCMCNMCVVCLCDWWR